MRVGEKALHGVRHEMGGRVTDDFETLTRVWIDRANDRVMVKRSRQVDEPVVDGRRYGFGDAALPEGAQPSERLLVTQARLLLKRARTASVAATARMAINCSSESPGWIVAGAAGGGAVRRGVLARNERVGASSRWTIP